MLSKRIIPCFDIKDGQTVKGIRFEQLRSVGDPVEQAIEYQKQGADELVFLDITATHEGRKTLVDLVKKIARNISIPFTVGGGISEINDVSVLLESGADKVSLNSSAVRNPALVTTLAKEFGSQCIVVAVDCKQDLKDAWQVYVRGGREATGLEVLSWTREVVDRGAGELLLTSMDHDGLKQGFACELTKQVSGQVSVPVIASGGAGTIGHFEEVFKAGAADAALAASIFHFGEIYIGDLKVSLKESGVSIRL